jgi:hypothetical protein
MVITIRTLTTVLTTTLLNEFYYSQNRYNEEKVYIYYYADLPKESAN